MPACSRYDPRVLHGSTHQQSWWVQGFWKQANENSECISICADECRNAELGDACKECFVRTVERNRDGLCADDTPCVECLLKLDTSNFEEISPCVLGPPSKTVPIAVGVTIGTIIIIAVIVVAVYKSPK